MTEINTMLLPRTKICFSLRLRWSCLNAVRVLSSVLYSKSGAASVSPAESI